jgi:chromosome segregation ATPase
MISLEQVKLLDSKVARTIDYLKKVIDENRQLKEKLSSYQKRIDELDVLVAQFRQDQNRIEDGILSALDRLNQFEGAVESLLSAEAKHQPPAAAEGKLQPPPATETLQSPAKLPDGPVITEEDSRELDIF